MLTPRTTNLTFIKEPDGQPVKIRIDETSQFAEGSANVSITTFLSGLQKLPEIGRPRVISDSEPSRKPHITS